ncbi:curli production assembly/transport component CsgF [Reichenbachiella faecimaris]|uniref:Curli production assembly/transport component CsgF n=1 Tax=Reichenbachiella faecimaris TaxID=692418 RepID=A0A1W2GK42_REIFA|nr:curli production assembly/transport component CsgF [Reichenbachiella faecimaris]SMD36852.1 curli production assembly/transport component CsgF [Reichenbachiella faecimaris]
MNLFKLFYALCLVYCSTQLYAQDFVYKPINPAFGGDTFNYNWLLSSAQEQNQYDEANANDPFGTGIDNFEENLNRQVLSLLSRQLVSDAFGEGTLQDGVYSIGSYEIEVSSNTSGINIYLFNTDDGSETTVAVPFY